MTTGPNVLLSSGGSGKDDEGSRTD
jgi:hypothetical protein